MPEPAQENATAPPVAREDQPSSAPSPGGGGATAAAVAPEREDESERWLETIAYALLALAGVAALATLIMWRSLRQQRRIADALEALAQR